MEKQLEQIVARDVDFRISRIICRKSQGLGGFLPVLFGERRHWSQGGLRLGTCLKLAN